MKVNTSINTLKKVWNILKELEVDGLLTGDELKIQPGILLDKLLLGGQLNKVCQIITGTDEDFENKDIEEVAELLKNFFGTIMKVFGVSNLIKMNQEIQNQKETPSIS